MKSNYNVFKPLQQFFAVVVILVLVAGTAQFASADADKVDICHFPPGNPENVQFNNVAEASLDAHLAHGDFVIENQSDHGQCQTLIDEASEPDPEMGTIKIIKLVDDAAGESVDFDFSGAGSFTIKGGESETLEVEVGSYTVVESQEDGWSLTSVECDIAEDAYVVDINAGSVAFELEKDKVIECSFTNSKDATDENPDVEVATIIAHKIVCDAESYLPDWAPLAGVPTIDAETAADFLALDDNAEHCKLVDWDFEWAPKGTSNPGNSMQYGGANWTTFTNQTEIEVGNDWDYIWIREVFDTDYIPFTGTSDSDPVSAELSCNVDSYHYDNYDRVDDIENNKTFHCVAFNVLKEVDEEPEDKGKIVVFKKVLDNDGPLQPDEFSLYVEDEESNKTNMSFGYPKHFALGTYTIGEEPEVGYEHVKTYCEVANKDDFDDTWNEDDFTDYIDWSFNGEVTLDEDGDIALCLVINRDIDRDDNGGGGGNNGEDLYLVYGYVWNDEDKDAIWDGVDEEESQEEEVIEEDETEDSLKGWTVEITNGDDTFTTTTDEDGYYEFEVPEGTWTISEIVMEGWSQTAPAGTTHEVTVPESESLSFLDAVIGFVIPTAYAQTVSSFGAFNFGNAIVVTTTPTPTGGGGGGGGGGSRISLSDGGGNTDPVPEVLGEQVAVIPLGAPNTGAGGSSVNRVLLAFFAILGIAVSLGMLRLTRDAQSDR